MVRRLRRREAVVAALIVAVAATFAVWLLHWYSGSAFDPEAWQDEALVEQGIRLGMADRLVARDTLRGKTCAEVVELLGEPTETGKFGDWDLVYWLGPERGFIGIDSEWLVVRFAPDGRVAEYRIVRD